MKHLKIFLICGSLLILAAPAAAGSWSVGIGVGFGYPHPLYGPGHFAPYDPYGPPPFGPPTYYVPAPPPVVFEMQPPDAVLDALESAGYREFGPMQQRGDHYSLSAVSPRGDIVALEISVYSGAIERELILEPRRRDAPRQVLRRLPEAPSEPPASAPPPPPSGEVCDPLVIC
jgi:hypothetical protein